MTYAAAEKMADKMKGVRYIKANFNTYTFDSVEITAEDLYQRGNMYQCGCPSKVVDIDQDHVTIHFGYSTVEGSVVGKEDGVRRVVFCINYNGKEFRV